MSTAETFNKIKELVHSVLPDAEVLLFGSRANGTAWEESDWDVLILTKEEVDRKLKDKIFDVLYPYSIKIGSFIHFILANKNEWPTHPRYYSLHLSISQNPMMM